jgi:hypothetical protein
MPPPNCLGKRLLSSCGGGGRSRRISADCGAREVFAENAVRGQPHLRGRNICTVSIADSESYCWCSSCPACRQSLVSHAPNRLLLNGQVPLLPTTYAAASFHMSLLIPQCLGCVMGRFGPGVVVWMCHPAPLELCGSTAPRPPPCAGALTPSPTCPSSFHLSLLRVTRAVVAASAEGAQPLQASSRQQASFTA